MTKIPPIEFNNLIIPPFHGTSEILTWNDEEILERIDIRDFSDYWKSFQSNNCMGNKKNITPEIFLKNIKKEILTNNLIDPRGYYGFFPVISENETLYILSQNDFHTEIGSLHFPRKKENKNQSIVDYFRPEGDIIAIQVVTIGTSYCRYWANQKIFNKDNYQAFYLDGFGSYLVNLLSEKVNTEIKLALFLQKNQGKRFNFNSPFMPDLKSKKIIFDIMCLEDRLGLSLTSNNSKEPNNYLLEIFVHHPEIINL